MTEEHVFMLDLAFPHGDRVALSLALLARLEYFPTESPEMIVALFPPSTVIIRGAHLAPLYEGLCARRVARVTVVGEVSVEGRFPSVVTSIVRRPGG